MNPPIIARRYDDWRHGITILCGIPLTPANVEAGPTWFAPARSELAAGAAR